MPTKIAPRPTFQVTISPTRVAVAHSLHLPLGDDTVCRLGMAQLFRVAALLIEVPGICGAHPYVEGTRVVLEMSEGEDSTAVARQVVILLAAGGYQVQK